MHDVCTNTASRRRHIMFRPICDYIASYTSCVNAQKLKDSPGEHITCPVLSYSFTCALQSSEAAIGLPAWLLSNYQTEVVSCHLCMIADSLNQVKCVRHTMNTSAHILFVTRPWHVFTPVHSSSWISLGAFTKHYIHPICRLRRRVRCTLGFYKQWVYGLGLVSGGHHCQHRRQSVGGIDNRLEYFEFLLIALGPTLPK